MNPSVAHPAANSNPGAPRLSQVSVFHRGDHGTTQAAFHSPQASTHACTVRRPLKFKVDMPTSANTTLLPPPDLRHVFANPS